MSAWDLQLFERLNASAVTPHWLVALATAVAQWVIWLVPLWLVVAWFRSDAQGRRELLQVVAAIVFALGLGQAIVATWPQPRPFMVHLGTDFLAHAPDPGFPSDHVTVLWTLACATLITRGFARTGIFWFVLGLLVGWARVFLGVHFPLDVLGALPVAVVATGLAWALRRPMQPVYAGALRLWDRIARPWQRT